MDIDKKIAELDPTIRNLPTIKLLIAEIDRLKEELALPSVIGLMDKMDADYQKIEQCTKEACSKNLKKSLRKIITVPYDVLCE